MSERTKYTPGAFSWVDLTTTDQDAAKTFYSELFGWTAVDNPVGDGNYYSIMQLDGAAVAAISTQPQQQRDAGIPPVWNNYITVESADATLEQAKNLSATIHAPAFDVFDFGRMGVVQDPQGAFFLAWEPKSHIGASLVNAPGALCWNELASPDLDASSAFYAELFGWSTEPMEGADPPYVIIKNTDGVTNGGMRPVMPPGTPPHWLAYFGIADIEAAMAQVERRGGTTIVAPMQIGPGTIAVAQDPQGAIFALYMGDYDG